MCSGCSSTSHATQVTPQGRQKKKALLPFPAAVISPPLILPPLVSFPAIYNYDARGEEELSLQIGDTVHILEKYEGEVGLCRRASSIAAPQLRSVTHQPLSQPRSNYFNIFNAFEAVWR